jgi:uroporphyrinogen III methyltransferase/synthase
MGVTTAPHWTQSLVGAGLAGSTPAAIIRRCSWTDQQVIRCRLSTIVEELDRRKIRPPALIVVGAACDAAPTISWFQRRPLFGQTVLVTRPREQAYAMCAQLTEQGAGCLVQPAIEIGPPEDWSPVDQALRQLDRYDWIVFSSANGVRGLLDRLWAKHGDVRRLGAGRLAAIGPRTADALADYRLRADVQPAQYRAEALAETLARQASGQRFLLARASRGRAVLAEQLTAAGGLVDQVVVYDSRDTERPEAEIAAAIAEGRVDWITVTSSAIARSLVAMFGDELGRCRLASISPITSATLRECGQQPAVEAETYTTAGLIDAIISAGHVDSEISS